MARSTRIPLPGSVDPDTPVEVRLRLGRSAEEMGTFHLALPRVGATVLKTEWSLAGEEKQVLYPSGGTVAPPQPVRVPTGFAGLVRRGLGVLVGILVLALVGTFLTKSRNGIRRVGGLLSLLAATGLAVAAALSAAIRFETTAPLRISLPILPADEAVELGVKSVPAWQANLSWTGLALILAGVIVIGIARRREEFRLGAAGVVALFAGILWQRGSEEWFFALLAVVLAFGWLWPGRARRGGTGEKSKAGPVSEGEGAVGGVGLARRALPDPDQHPHPRPECPGGLLHREVDRAEGELRHGESKLRVSATIVFTESRGHLPPSQGPGRAHGLRGGWTEPHARSVEGSEPAYLVTIAGAPDPIVSAPAVAPWSRPERWRRLRPLRRTSSGPRLLLRTARARSVGRRAPADRPRGLRPDRGEARPCRMGIPERSRRAHEPPRECQGERERSGDPPRPGSDGHPDTETKIARTRLREDDLLRRGRPVVPAGPECSTGKHRFRIRPAQGRVSSLGLRVPAGLTVSEVTGPIESWQFDAEAGALSLAIEPPQTAPFEVLVTTQRGLAALPTELEIAPIRVTGAAGEVGLAALAFGPDAQPENATATGMSEVNPGDFDAALLPGEGILLTASTATERRRERSSPASIPSPPGAGDEPPGPVVR